MNAASAESSASMSCFMRDSDRDARAQLLRMDGLGQEFVGARLDAADAILQVGLAGDEHDRRQPRRRIGLEPAAHLEAVDAAASSHRAG